MHYMVTLKDIHKHWGMFSEISGIFFKQISGSYIFQMVYN